MTTRGKFSMPALVMPDGLQLSKSTFKDIRTLLNNYKLFTDSSEHQRIHTYTQENPQVMLFWASTALSLKDMSEIPETHQHRALCGPSGTKIYIFHHMIVTNSPNTSFPQIGIAGDIFIHPAGIAWHDGTRWQNWEHTKQITELPCHPILPGQRKLGFKLTHLCFVWTLHNTIRSYRQNFSMEIMADIPELTEHYWMLRDDLRIQNILSTPYVEVSLVDLSYLIRRCLHFYHRTLTSQRLGPERPRFQVDSRSQHAVNQEPYRQNRSIVCQSFYSVTDTNQIY